MDKYKIPCTEEQTKKVLKLDASIKIRPHVTQEKAIDFAYVESGIVFDCPTAEQLIGWLEEQGIRIEPEYDLTHKHYDFCIIDENKLIFEEEIMFNIEFGLPSYKTRKEATLSAIDTVLEYLINKTMEE